jgi:hypothetical protein
MKPGRARTGSDGADKDITITRVIRVDVTNHATGKRDWFDLAVTTELEVYVRIAGLPDDQPWEVKETSPVATAAISIRSVVMARRDEPLAPHPRAEMERLEREREEQFIAERKRSRGESYDEWERARSAHARELDQYEYKLLVWIGDQGDRVRFAWKELRAELQAKVKRLIDEGAVLDIEIHKAGVASPGLQLTAIGRQRIAEMKAKASTKYQPKWKQQAMLEDDAARPGGSLHDEDE